MKETFSRLMSEAVRPIAVPFFERLRDLSRGLSAGDKVIAGMFAFLLVVSALVATRALIASLLVEVPAPGGNLHEGVLGAPRFVNPLLALSDADRDLVSLTYAGLMGISGDGSLINVLAESYEISKDGEVYTFTIRENARFHDGTPVTAEDVVFTVGKAQDPALKSPKRADWDGVTAEVVDVRTVQFKLERPYAPFLENTTLGILPAHLWKNIGAEEFPFTELSIQPVGAGPFKVSRVSRNASGLAEEYELSAFPGYALGRPWLNGITLSFFSQEETLTKALLRGAVESAHSMAEAAPGALIRAPYSRVFGVFFNQNENPVFARLEVRKALSLALNREEITKNVLGGLATALEGPLPREALLKEIGSAERILGAAATLEKAGWSYNAEARLWKHAGAKLSLSLTVKTSNVPELRAVASAVRDSWQALGVPVSIELYEPGDLNQNVIRPRRYEALLFGMILGRDRDLFAFWHSSQRNDPGLNIALYTNHQVDALLEKARTLLDENERASALRGAAEKISAEYPAAFTHTPDFVYRIPSDLKGVALPEITAPSDRFAGVSEWYRRTESVWPFFAYRR